MAKLLDQVLVVDVESTCWQGPPPHGQLSEIIEVGLCTVDVRKRQRLAKRCIMIKPVRSRLSEFCTRLTTLRDEDLVGAGTLADAVSILKREYRSPDRLWASWGDYDRRQFERVCKELTVPYPFGVSHLNIKTLFAVLYGDNREIGVDEACERIGIPMEGTHHRGVDDAWNIAAIFCHLMEHFQLPAIPPQSISTTT
ncbi:Exonuclease RNase T and DNA polymerase III [Pirellula staleyi DSM 6068]|uniref:Exonuclease RNase T and DNA polymerase III n=1 Tax=Pirellula staleyi (strain ATCC 27377 / DSM 6068 / ICPB 4128) TaxID=530564 RepID=D2R2R4_PIRSD|nr:3'-5' exonuclease [Pirellula staleyi]ADB16904.1 Exonuclease RNase T and DNA polymerase III [Pirellula staleyi DSM 6068]